MLISKDSVTMCAFYKLNLVFCYFQSIEQADEMEEVPRNSDQVTEYEKEIRELRWQLQKLQEAGNLMDYTGKNHCILLSCIK